jgi:hypothetical protein
VASQQPPSESCLCKMVNFKQKGQLVSYSRRQPRHGYGSSPCHANGVERVWGFGCEAWKLLDSCRSLDHYEIRHNLATGAATCPPSPSQPVASKFRYGPVPTGSVSSPSGTVRGQKLRPHVAFCMLLRARYVYAHPRCTWTHSLAFATSLKSRRQQTADEVKCHGLRTQILIFQLPYLLNRTAKATRVKAPQP